MDDYYYKRSGQIPAFGDWECANELPITQYFECARQAGLIRYSSSSGESDPYARTHHHDLYAVDLHKPSRITVPPTRKTRGREKRCPPHAHVKEHHKKQHHHQSGKVFDVTEPPRKLHQQLPHHGHDVVSRPPRLTTTARPPKPVDEDLYKIPPELLRNTKRKKMLGIFSRCLVPACTI